MFAIFLSDKMDPFYHNILSFPTIIFTIALVFSMLFWMVAILGMLDISFLDFTEMDIDSEGQPSAVSGIIMRLGLTGVPITVIVTLISLIGWFICYHLVDLVFPFIPEGVLTFLAGIPVFISVLYVSARITALIIRPLRPLFIKMEQNVENLLMGQVAIVRTSRVDERFGEAILEDGGAGLILKVRASEGNKFTRGDRVVLIEHLEKSDAFRIVSEQEFQGL